MDTHAVAGREVGGIVHYSFDGQSWTIDDPHSTSRTGPRTVYVIAADPSSGSLDDTGTEVLDWAVTCGPALLGLVLLAVGFTRRARNRHRRGGQDGSFGHGIPTEVIDRIKRAPGGPSMLRRTGGQ